MKIAIIGSRNICIKDFSQYLGIGDEVVSGGANGIDTCAADYARKNGLLLTEFLPEWERFGRAAPIVRNKQIVDYADRVIAFWNGTSKGTLSVIRYAQKTGKPCEVVLCTSRGARADKKHHKNELP